MTTSDENLRTERLAFYEADLDRIDRCLAEFLKLSGATCALLVDKDGHAVTRAGEANGFDADTISALVAGSFAATRQIAKLLGEAEFSSLYHQGEKDHMLIQLVGDRSLMTVLFDGKTTLGMVRLYATEAAKRLGEVYDEVARRGEGEEPQAPFVEGYGEQASKQIGDVFGDL